MPCGNSACPFFELQAGNGSFSGAEIQCIVTDAVQPVSFKQGEVLFLQGQASSSLYALTKGMVKICTHTPDGREQIVGLSNPDNLLVGLQSLNDQRYAYTGIAATAVRACKINHRTLLARVQDKGDVAMRLIRAVNAQLAHSRALMEVMGHKCAAAKIASFILLMTPKSEHGNCRFALPTERGNRMSHDGPYEARGSYLRPTRQGRDSRLESAARHRGWLRRRARRSIILTASTYWSGRPAMAHSGY
jgi:CRP-like cAMP-binding protein